MKRSPPKRQRGVALLLAVLLSALAALLAFAIIDSQAVALQRTHAQMRGAQLDEFARGVEVIASIALRRDEANVDHNSDAWRQPLVLDIPRGRLAARMRDLNGCFNVNAFADPDAGFVAESHARLTRLLLALELDPEIADAIADYVDVDQATRDRGAENLRYLGGRPAYRTADRPLAHVSELRAVAGVDAETYRRLAEEVCALAPRAKINVNTASVALLRSLGPDIDQARAAALAADGNARHTDIEQFMLQVDETHAQRPANPHGTLDVVSDEFLLESEIEYDGVKVAYWAHLTRRAGQVRVEARGRGRYR